MEGNEVIVKAAANKKMNSPATAAPSVPVSETAALDVLAISTDLSYSDVNDDMTPEDDEFYDACEFSMRFSKEEERSNLIEQQFGFSLPRPAIIA
jgi:hypothetical protein